MAKPRSTCDLCRHRDSQPKAAIKVKLRTRGTVSNVGKLVCFVCVEQINSLVRNSGQAERRINDNELYRLILAKNGQLNLLDLIPSAHAETKTA